MKTVEPMSVEGRIKIPYRWPAGRLGTHFLAALRDQGRILGLRCTACDLVHVPPRPSCLECGGTPDEWVPVGPGGELKAVSVRGRDCCGLIQLDGASSCMVHRLIVVPSKSVGPGTRVIAEFAETRVGAITDICGFRPM